MPGATGSQYKTAFLTMLLDNLQQGYSVSRCSKNIKIIYHYQQYHQTPSCNMAITNKQKIILPMAAIFSNTRALWTQKVNIGEG